MYAVSQYGNQFPDKVDTWEFLLDVTLELKPYVEQFYRFYDAGDFEAAEDVLEQNPVLKRMIVNADNINRVYSAVMALERFFWADVDKYLLNVVKNRGDFDPAKQYTKYDVVFVARDDAKEAFMGLQTGIPIGNAPHRHPRWNLQHI